MTDRSETSTRTSEYAKFLPEGIPNWQRPFWDSLRAHQMRVQRCDNCGRYRYIPKELCRHCHAEVATWTPVRGNGTVYTFTVVRRAPTPAYEQDVPYVIAYVEMDEGFRMASNLIEVVPEDVRIGMRVKVVYEDATPEWTLFKFVPA